MLTPLRWNEDKFIVKVKRLGLYLVKRSNGLFKFLIQFLKNQSKLQNTALLLAAIQILTYLQLIHGQKKIFLNLALLYILQTLDFDLI